MSNAAYFAQYAALKTVLTAAAPLPLAAKRVVVGRTFEGFVRASSGLRKRADANLRMVFPDMADDARAETVRQVARNVGGSLCDLWYSDAMARTCAGVEPEGDGYDILKAARDRGQAVIILTGHFGRFEAVRHVLKRGGMETGGIFRPNNNPYYDRMWVTEAEKTGSPVIPTGKEGQKALHRHLSGGGFLEILVDQAMRKGERIDFLGHPAWTSLGAAILAKRYKALLMTAFAPMKDDGTPRAVFDAPIPEGEPVEMLAEYNRRLGSWVRAHPSQWHWFHNRWKDYGRRKA